MPVQLQYVQLITDKTNAADLSGRVFTILISVTRTIKIQNPLLLHKFRQPANRDITWEALNCSLLHRYSNWQHFQRHKFHQAYCSVIPKPVLLKSGSGSGKVRVWNTVVKSGCTTLHVVDSQENQTKPVAARYESKRHKCFIHDISMHKTCSTITTKDSSM